jgi:hypothetical protein
MIKGISFLRPAGSPRSMTGWRAFLRRWVLLPARGGRRPTAEALRFWLRSAIFEFVDGKFPSTADVLVEVTALDAVHQAAEAWLRAQGGEAAAAALADYGDPLEVAHLHRRAGARICVQLLGLDRSAQRQARCDRRRSLGRGHEVCHRGGALECGDHRAPAGGRIGCPAAQRSSARRYRGGARAGRVGDSGSGADDRRTEEGGCDHHSGLPVARRDGALRSHLQRSGARHRAVAAGDGRSAQLWRADLRDAGAGAEPRRHQGREQGIRSGGGGD